jgi:hypothetical protein
VALCGAPTAFGQQNEPTAPAPPETFTEYGRTARKAIEPSNQGVWDGTWMYVNREARMVLWIKTEGGVPQVKFQYFSTSSAEGFSTDWTTKAEYTMPLAQGRFSMDLKKRDANVIEGHWDWHLDSEKSSRSEEGDYRMYRTGDGRFLVMDFTDYRKTLLGKRGERVFTTHPSWTFQKVSKRLVLWDELPF